MTKMIITTEYVTEYNGLILSGWVGKGLIDGRVEISTWPESKEAAIAGVKSLARVMFPGVEFEVVV